MLLNRSPSAPSAGIPEDLQPAARDHRLGETRLQTVPPGEKSFGGSSVPPSKKNPSATREGAQPQPGAVSPPLGAGGGQAQILVPVPFGGLVFAHLLLQTSCNAHSPREEGLGGGLPFYTSNNDRNPARPAWVPSSSDSPSGCRSRLPSLLLLIYSNGLFCRAQHLPGLLLPRVLGRRGLSKASTDRAARWGVPVVGPLLKNK